MASDLKSVRGEYIFFAAYLQKDSEQENWDTNGAMLSNFLAALEKSGAMADVNRIILVTGCKQYGVHLGAVKLPMVESDAWLEGDQWPPNFYYNQQNILHDFCQKHGKEWVVTYPNDVVGFATGNYMNLALSIALYAIVSKEMDKSDEGLVFPGSPNFYCKFDCFTSAKLHAEFCAWAATAPKAANQAFNVVNGDAETWANLWPKVTAYFGSKVKADQFSNGQGGVGATLKGLVGAKDGSSTSYLAREPPLSTCKERLGLQGTEAVQQSKVEQHIDLIGWSRRQDVKDTWTSIAERSGLDKSVFEKATWGFLGFVLGRNFNLMISMSKAREAGWTGYRDTWGSLEEVFGEMREAGVLPKA
jgi:nucleoside-diphosphate-sugar epimerase